jgi:NHLM bacteriocin system ABC transporter ATP-binding protein
MTQPLRWVAGNRAIPLDGNTQPATLLSGSMAVFAIDRETGERQHLFSLGTGDDLHPLPAPEGAPWEIAAVPLEASCLRGVEDAGDWKSILARENWLAKTGEAVGRLKQAPARVAAIEAGQTVQVKPGDCLAAERGMVAVHLTPGDGLLCGRAAPQSAVLALIPGLWLEAQTEGEWRVSERADADAVAATTELAVQILFSVLDEMKEERRKATRNRFDARHEVNRRASQTAMEGLAGLTGREHDAAGVPLSGDALLDAMRVVGDALRVPVRPFSVAGRRSDAVQEIAQASGLRSRTVVLARDWWRRDSGPLIGQRNDGTPVALLWRRRGYEIVDPGAHSRERVNRTTAAELSGFAQMLYVPLPENLSARGLLRHLLATQRRDIRTTLISGAAAAVLALAMPQGIAILMSQAIPDANTAMIWQAGAGLAAAALGSAIFLLVQAIALFRIETAAFATIETGVWDHLLKLSPAFFRGFTAGQLRLRADAAVRIFQTLSADALRSIFAGAGAVVSLLLILWYSPVLALISLVAGLLIVAQTWIGSRALYRVQQEWQEAEELLSGLVLQSIQAVSKLRVAGAEDRAFSQWAREYTRKQRLSLELQGRRDRMRLFNLVVPTAASAVIFFCQLQQPIALGPFLACNAALTAFLAALASASDSFAGVILVGALWQRLCSLLAAKPEVDKSKGHPGRLRGAISVDNLMFRYRADGPMILDGVSIQAEPGECIALTGPSGCGKSTLLNLILRFETPHSGAIYLDGRDLSSLDVTAVRRQIGAVTQDGRILAGSMFENICPGGANTMDDAWEAARAAGLAEDIESMPMGMHTVISENGGNLSGGQRQRLLIARALVLKPTIVIFDEATSALDNRTQAIVTESLNRLKATRILVAHRLNTIRQADRIYVIEKGRIVQLGRFEELAAAPGLFARLVHRQT